jgi:hypothetical protein
MASRKRQATVEDLLSKPARRQEVQITVPGEKGDQVLSLQLVAISAREYDDLLAGHPPTKEQEKDGQSYNGDTFGPALIAAVVADPKISVEQAGEIWTGETWSRGEIRDLFLACVNLCSKGLDVPFTSAG